MLKLFNRKKKDNKGFTLVELVIVIAILAILVGILAPQYTKYVEKARKAADASNLENIVTVLKTAAADSTDTVKTGTYTVTIGDSGTVVTASGDDSSAVADIESILTEFAGNDWKNTKLKSKKWTADDGTAISTILATITVENTGKVTVAYTPTKLKDKAN